MNGIGQVIDYVEIGLRQFPEGALRPILIALLGFTLLWSGIAKVRSPWSAALAIVDFGVARRPSLRFAWGMIIGELGLGVALLIAPAVTSTFVVITTAAASCMFLMFSVLISRSLRAGQSFACACFGSEEEGLTRKTLARSAALGLVAGTCAAGGFLGPPLTLADLALTWCAAAGILGTGVLLTRSHQLVQLPRFWSVEA